MKKLKLRITKPVFFIILILIVAFTVTSTLGVSTRYGDTEKHIIWGIDDIRWGIDIRGGVNVSFGAPEDYAEEITDNDLAAARSIIETRLIDKSINDYEIYVDNNTRTIIVRFPWQADDAAFDPQAAVKEIGETAMLTFRESYEVDENGLPTGKTENIILQGRDVANAYVGYDPESVSYYVGLELNSEGASKFTEATGRLVGDTISIWMDDICISYPRVNQQISGNTAQITSPEYSERAPAEELANKINGGSLPFKLEVKNLSTISPILGTGARDAMAIAGVIAFILIAIYMIAYYRLPGVVAVISLIGQIAGMFAAITGYFSFNDASSLTLPGIAGLILSIGMGVDANVVSNERIREEIRAGRTIDGAIKNGFERGFAAILDGNLTVIIVAVILMLIFGTTFGVTTDGTIYSFGYTLLAGIVMNFVMGCWATRLMITALSKFKVFRKTWFFGVSSTVAKTSSDEMESTSNTVEVKTRTNFDYVGKTKLWAIISGSLILLIVVFSFILKPEAAIQFTGGTMVTYTYTGEVDVEDIEKTVSALGTTTPTVTTGTSLTGDMQTIVVSFAADEKMNDEMLTNVTNTLIAAYPENNLENIDTTNVSASSGSLFFVNCLIAVVIAFVLLDIYIALRFKKIGGWSAGIIAICCLLHDVAITYGVYVFCGMPLDSNFMAVILTLLGYSINNTIIIYDRLRENRARYGSKKNDHELVNLSINQTLTRSINTSLMTLVATACVSIVCAARGITSILSFSIPLTVGIIAGFYSSVCLAGPIWIWWQEHKSNKKKAQA